MINIKVRTRNLVRKYGTRDPEKLAKELGIQIIKKPFIKTMGFFKKELGIKFIVVNSNLDELTQNIVLAHELGHAMLHSNKNTVLIHEYTLFPRGKVEIEANKFAAELLINEKEIDKHSLNEFGIYQLASYFGVPKLLIEYKFTKVHKLI